MRPMDISKSGLASGRFLTFRLGEESFGIDVLTVQEIIRLPRITPVPQLPAYLRGVINLRGHIIPVTDLHLRLFLSKHDDSPRSCVVVVKVERTAQRPMLMGLVVDAVEDVVHITAEEMSPPPELGASVDTSLLLALARVKGTVKSLIDIGRVLTESQVAQAAAAA